MNKILVIVILLAVCGLIACGVLVATVVFGEVSRPVVQIHEPQGSVPVTVGQETTVHAIARDESKIVRVELWADGALLDTETSSLAGGTSPFPVRIAWRPRTPGAHTLTVRAYNPAGVRGHASITVTAVATVTATAERDRDGDGVPDATDACPDQAGPPAQRGCPAPGPLDRDGDGVADSADACPDLAGAATTAGCPDADGDGVRDADDACPRDAGLPAQRGCPAPGDRDGDGVADTTDACPDAPGSAALAGCPDGDGDGVRDADDACPADAGPASASGCPDRDGDGVRDAFDLCPDAPGLRENSGCPASAAGDRDGDGVRDDTDLAPDEPGSAEAGGAPPPGGGADSDGDGTADDDSAATSPLDELGGVAPGPRLVGVTFEALELKLNEDYDEVYCYAALGETLGVAERIGPLRALETRRWDIAESLGGANSRFLSLTFGASLLGHMRCHAYTIHTIPGEGAEGTYWDLGSFSAVHPASDWDGHVITQRSSGGASGRNFEVQYRVCRGTCRNTEFPPPIITLFSIGGRRQMVWLWDGNKADIDGYKLYAGNTVLQLRDSLSSYWLPAYLGPACGTQATYQMTAFRGDRESPRSNIAYWTGERCPRTVRVTFQSFTVSGLGDDELQAEHEVGPIRGEFYAEGNARQALSFKGDNCRFFWIGLIPLYKCYGYELNNGTYSVAAVFEAIRGATGGCDSDSDCRASYSAPTTNAVIVELGANDDLSFGGRVIDRDELTDDETLFDAGSTLRAADIRTGTHTLSNRKLELTVSIEVLAAP